MKIDLDEILTKYREHDATLRESVRQFNEVASKSDLRMQEGLSRLDFPWENFEMHTFNGRKHIKTPGIMPPRSAKSCTCLCAGAGAKRSAVTIDTSK